jgi:hypothetical protein
MAVLRAMRAGDGVADWPAGWEARWDYACDVLLVIGPGGQNFRVTREKLENAGSVAAVKRLLLDQPNQFLDMVRDEPAEWIRGAPVAPKARERVGVDVTRKGRVLDLD